MSIKARLLIAITVLVALAFAVTGVATVTVTRAQMIDRVDASLMTVANKDPHGPPGGSRGPRSNVEQTTASILLGPSGQILGSTPSGFSDDPDPLPDLSSLDPSDLADRRGEIFTTGAVNGSDLRYRTLIHDGPNGQFIVTAAPLDGVDGTIDNLIIVIAATSVGVLLLLCGIVWLVIRHGLRPVDDMIATAGVIAAGDLSQRVDHDDQSTEVGQLGHALNVMLGRIETSFEAKEASERRLRQFVADASHELRTPLTSIRGYAELYRAGAVSSPDAVDRSMARIEAEGIRMSRLVEDLLLLARLDQGRPLRSEPVDLVQLVSDAVTDARAVEPERPIGFDHPPQALVVGDADRLRQVIDNLLSNARVHTEPGVPVQVTVAEQADDIVLTVADEGPGISPDDAEHVFDRFFRVDTSRSRARGGTGLGLSIVAAIVEAHAGSVALDTAPGEGATISVALPRAAGPPTPEAEPEIEPQDQPLSASMLT